MACRWTISRRPRRRRSPRPPKMQVDNKEDDLVINEDDMKVESKEDDLLINEDDMQEENHRRAWQTKRMSCRWNPPNLLRDLQALCYARSRKRWPRRRNND